MGGIQIISKTSTKTSYEVFYSESHRDGTYTAYLRGKRCHKLMGLFREFSAAFQFPSYFGDNWDALDECLCDLDWLLFTRIVLIIDNFNEMLCKDEKEKSVLMSILRTAIDYWEMNNVEFKVYLFEKG